MKELGGCVYLINNVYNIVFGVLLSLDYMFEGYYYGILVNCFMLFKLYLKIIVFVFLFIS